MCPVIFHTGVHYPCNPRSGTLKKRFCHPLSPGTKDSAIFLSKFFKYDGKNSKGHRVVCRRATLTKIQTGAAAPNDSALASGRTHRRKDEEPRRFTAVRMDRNFTINSKNLEEGSVTHRCKPSAIIRRSVLTQSGASHASHATRTTAIARNLLGVYSYRMSRLFP